MAWKDCRELWDRRPVSTSVMHPCASARRGLSSVVVLCSYVRSISYDHCLIYALFKALINLAANVRFLRNRRDNERQKRFGLLAFVSGATSRLHNYLADRGEVTSHTTAIRDAKSLGRFNSAALKAASSRAIQRRVPLRACLDNLDISDRVSLYGMNRETVIKHGAYGFLMEQPDVSPQAFDIQIVRSHIHSLPPVVLADLLPSPEGIQHFKGAAFAHAMRAVNRFLKRSTSNVRVPPSWLKIQSVEPVPCTPPPVYLLQLMEESDAATADIPILLDAVRRQMDCSKDDFFGQVLLIDVDGGSQKLFESARGQRHPASRVEDGLETVIPVLGGAHTMWAAAAAIWATHGTYAVNEHGLNAGSLGVQADVLRRTRPPEKGKIKDQNQLVSLLLDVGDTELVSRFLRAFLVTSTTRSR